MKIIKTRIKGIKGYNYYRLSEYDNVIEEVTGVMQDALKYDKDFDYTVSSEESCLTEDEIGDLDKIKFVEN